MSQSNVFKKIKWHSRVNKESNVIKLKAFPVKLLLRVYSHIKSIFIYITTFVDTRYKCLYTFIHKQLYLQMYTKELNKEYIYI